MAWGSARVAGLVLGVALACSGAPLGAQAAVMPSSYASSAHISPYIVTAHLQLALAHLRAAENAMVWDRGNGESIALTFSATRSELADAADQLGLARMATVDPDERSRLDGLLSGIDDVRSMLDTQALRVPGRLRELQTRTLEVHQAVHAQIARTESALARTETADSSLRNP